MRTLPGIRTETCRIISCRRIMDPGDEGMPANRILSEKSRGWVCAECVKRIRRYDEERRR